MEDVGFGAAVIVRHTLERLKKKKLLDVLRSLLGTRGQMEIWWLGCDGL